MLAYCVFRMLKPSRLQRPREPCCRVASLSCAKVARARRLRDLAHRRAVEHRRVAVLVIQRAIHPGEAGAVHRADRLGQRHEADIGRSLFSAVAKT